MTKAEFAPWRKEKLGLKQPDITAINWSLDHGLRIYVSDGIGQKPQLCIEFCLERSFRCTDEGYRLMSLPSLSENEVIWHTEDSEYLRQFRADAATTMDNFPLIHWLIISANQCVDVLCEQEPKLSAL